MGPPLTIILSTLIVECTQVEGAGRGPRCHAKLADLASCLDEDKEWHPMRAFVVTKYKEPLQEADVPEPTVGEHDVLVRVEAAGLNPLDEKIRAGEFKQILPYKLPLILGNDVAGTVIRVGTAVRDFKPGDEVYARPHQDRIGTFAERIAVAEGD